MGNNQTINKLNFEDVQFVVKNHKAYLLINTLPPSEQQCLIANTLPAVEEEMVINQLLANNHRAIKIVLYGRNNSDETVIQKHKQLATLGFHQVFVYVGGLFEWLLLQEIYGADLFPTSSNGMVVDLLKYKGAQGFALHF